MCSAALCWRGLVLQARVFYFVLQSTALLRVSLGRCERLLREQRTVGIATGECLLRVCAVTRRRFPVGASPTRQPLQPEATGAVMEVTKWLKPSVSGSRIGDRASVQAVT